MNATPGPPQRTLAGTPGLDPHAGQHFGCVTQPGPASTSPGTYLVRDDDTSVTYSFTYADIVTEGLRTIRPGERVRFLIDPLDSEHASYVIRLDLPDIEDYS